MNASGLGLLTGLDEIMSGTTLLPSTNDDAGVEEAFAGMIHAMITMPRTSVCWSICVVWPARAPYEHGQRSPEYYFLCMRDAVARYVANGDRVIVHCHALTAQHVRNVLPRDDAICVRECALTEPDYYPTAARVASMMDGDAHAGGMPIVCADCHDPLEEQEHLLMTMLDALSQKGKALALTLWAADGNELRYECATMGG